MFISRNESKSSSGKIYHSVLLRESYREGKSVKKRTIANISHCNEEEISAIQFALKFKDNLTPRLNGRFRAIQGKSIGSIYVLHSIACKLGIVEALGSSFYAKLALWLIYARILEQGSRLSAIRLNNQYDIPSVIKLRRGFDENDLYDCLHWMDTNQIKIENSLFKKRNDSQNFYWYDVTSSYFEGAYNELAAFGYNRDKKKQKRIIVVGLLCQNDGHPVSIEVFKGNTQDTLTFENQLIKLKSRFECQSVTLICDRGLIKDKQKKLLKEYGFHYITALPMPKVQALLKRGEIRLNDFTDELKDYNLDGLRYIYRRNPQRALEASKQRQERYECAQKKVELKNKYLSTHPKAQLPAALKSIQKTLKTYCLHEWVSAVIINGNIIALKVDEEQLKMKSEMDGCYIWTTDLNEENISTKEVYDRYKDLKYVEDDFRMFKTGFLEVRPVFVRTEESTRGHLLIVMLSHLIIRELRKKWSHLDKTVSEGLNELSRLCRNTFVFDDIKIERIPEPNKDLEDLLKAVKVVMPKSLEEIKVPVVTRHKVRKSVKI